MKNFLLPVLILLVSISGHAQSPDIPSGPLVATETPAFSHWTVTCTYAGGDNDAKRDAAYSAAAAKMAASDPVLARMLATRPDMMHRPRLKQRNVIKTGKVRVESWTYADGKQEEKWQNEKGAVTRSAFTGKFTVQMLDGEKTPDFPEFAWLNAGNFKEIKMVNGNKCMVFVGKIQVGQIEDPIFFAKDARPVEGDEATITATAVINLETRMPVSVQYRDQTRKYEYPPAPTVALTMPPEFAAVVQQVEERTKARNAPLSPP